MNEMLAEFSRFMLVLQRTIRCVSETPLFEASLMPRVGMMVALTLGDRVVSQK